MEARSIHPDIGAHEAGCPKLDTPDAPAADPIRYVDVFCECHKYTDPKILTTDTDIAWPADGMAQGKWIAASNRNRGPRLTAGVGPRRDIRPGGRNLRPELCRQLPSAQLGQLSHGIALADHHHANLGKPGKFSGRREFKRAQQKTLVRHRAKLRSCSDTRQQLLD
jgi:hypothetical protein